MLVVAACLIMLIAQPALAVPKKNIGYFGFSPDITTNYVSNKRNIGFIRVTVELMIDDVANVSIVEHHAPLLRDGVVDVFIKQPEQKIKSMTGREEIRLKILDRMQELLKKETGQTLVFDVLFTKYLYH